MKKEDFDAEFSIQWCPGCGNFAILDVLKETLAELKIDPTNLVVISGIGQAGKTPHFLKCNYINGLHGRALPVATAIKALNPELEVIAIGGDGDMYGEGGNHLIHAIRRNIDITTIAHNNMVYGLTKGQASPTSQQGFTTKVQKYGVHDSPFNPISFAISQDISFIARTFSAEKDHMKKMMKAAIQNKGFALLDIFQPCVSFNKTNTFKWFREKSYKIEKDEHDPTDQVAAFELSLKREKYPLGILYKKEKPTYTEKISVYQDNKEPVCKRERDIEKIAQKFLTAH
jgi:2-oxoglutarate ferredoxin oxidoreductase subunit beta